MKPSTFDKRLGKLTMEQYLGLSHAMSSKVANRMLALAADYAGDAIGLHDDGLDPRHDLETLTRLARSATRVEMRLAQLLTLAAEHCREPTLLEIPESIRSHVKTASRCRSAICLMAMTTEQHVRDDRLAA